MPSIANTIVINEIHYDENDKTLRAEFIELYNNGEESVDMSLWYFSDGIDYTFKERSEEHTSELQSHS